MATPAPTKDAITCHVLDTTTGRPARGISVQLQFDGAQLPASDNPYHNQLSTFSATTNSDGRITNWIGDADRPSIAPVIEFCQHYDKPMVWTLKFDTGAYFGPSKTFWPEVQLKFFVKPGEGYHVPLLLGPWSYTTYRGS